MLSIISSLNYNRWKVDYGKAWEHLGGEVFGQTQISYSLDDMISTDSSRKMVFNHPIDMHFAAAGLQVTSQYMTE
jgi:Ciliary basal body-associated, B9 protein